MWTPKFNRLIVFRQQQVSIIVRMYLFAIIEIDRFTQCAKVLQIIMVVYMCKCLSKHSVTQGLFYRHSFTKGSPADTVYPKKYAHGFVVLCFVVVMQSFIINSHEVFIHIHRGCFAGTGAIVRLPQCQWSKPGGYGKISQCITTTKHSKAKTVCIFLGKYCIYLWISGSIRQLDIISISAMACRITDHWQGITWRKSEYISMELSENCLRSRSYFSNGEYLGVYTQFM